jgi:hypothetical protein
MTEDKNKTNIIDNQKYRSNKKKDEKTSSRPVAYTGPNQIVYEGSTVQLDGSNSSSSSPTETIEDGTNLSYLWTQTDGSQVTIMRDRKDAKCKKRSKSASRPYRDLIEGRFDLAKVIHIDRKDDGNAIFGKAAEFSSGTINTLRKEGYNDVLMTPID